MAYNGPSPRRDGHLRAQVKHDVLRELQEIARARRQRRLKLVRLLTGLGALLALFYLTSQASASRAGVTGCPPQANPNCAGQPRAPGSPGPPPQDSPSALFPLAG